MPLGQATVARFGIDDYPSEKCRVVERLQDTGPPLCGEVHVSCCAVAEEQAEHVVADDRNARDDRQVLLAHSHHVMAAVLWRAGFVAPRPFPVGQ